MKGRYSDRNRNPQETTALRMMDLAAAAYGKEHNVYNSCINQSVSNVKVTLLIRDSK